MSLLTEPLVEGTVKVRGGRELGYAEFGTGTGRAVVWFHGTPGARRQVPQDARVLAETQGLRVIGVDRPGTGHSTPHLYPSVLDSVADLEILLDALGIGSMALVALSGGGPFALATAYALPDRVKVVGILGGVAPTQGPEGVAGGVVGRLSPLGPLLPFVRAPVSRVIQAIVIGAGPVGPQALRLYARISPEGDREVLLRPEVGAMFLDDLTGNGSDGIGAVVNDLILFLRPWGFSVADISVPVRWWHGDADHIVPLEHGRATAERLPNAEFYVRPGESHLGGLGIAGEVLKTILALWPDTKPE
jgi:pimeloyl-ACP methyl ester carboxylesterase